jgi:hypothetical protein
MLERTDTVTNEVTESIMFVVAYYTVLGQKPVPVSFCPPYILRGPVWPRVDCRL